MYLLNFTIMLVTNCSSRGGRQSVLGTGANNKSGKHLWVVYWALKELCWYIINSVLWIKYHSWWMLLSLIIIWCTEKNEPTNIYNSCCCKIEKQINLALDMTLEWLNATNWLGISYPLMSLSWSMLTRTWPTVDTNLFNF